MQSVLPALYWIVYFGVFLEWRSARLRGRGRARHRWLSLLETVAFFIAILGCLIAQLIQLPSGLRLRGGVSQEQDSGRSESRENHAVSPAPRVIVRMSQIVGQDYLENLRRAIDERLPIMVQVSGREPRPMFMEELAILFHEMESRRSKLLTRNEDGVLVRVSDVLPSWNEFRQLSDILARNEDGSLYWERIAPNTGRLFYKNPYFGAIQWDLKWIIEFSAFDENLRNNAFEVMNDGAVRRASIDDLNALNAEFDIYVRFNDGQIGRLDLPSLEVHYHAHPHVWMYGNWWLATPEVLAHIAGDEDNAPALALKYLWIATPMEPLMIPVPGQRFSKRANQEPHSGLEVEPTNRDCEPQSGVR